MSANITALPAAASAVAQIVSNGTSDPGAAAADMVDTQEPGSFDALFRQLLIKQNTTGADANPLLPASTALKSEVAKTENELSALLPFLDALGLTQPDPATTAVSPPAETAVAAAVAVPGLTTPADPAVSIDLALTTLAGPADSVDPTLTTLAGPASIPVANLPAISAAATTPGNRAAAALPSFAPGMRNIAPAAANTPASGLSVERHTEQGAVGGTRVFLATRRCHRHQQGACSISRQHRCSGTANHRACLAADCPDNRNTQPASCSTRWHLRLDRGNRQPGRLDGKPYGKPRRNDTDTAADGSPRGQHFDHRRSGNGKFRFWKPGRQGSAGSSATALARSAGGCRNPARPDAGQRRKRAPVGSAGKKQR